eukprot:220641_1
MSQMKSCNWSKNYLLRMNQMISSLIFMAVLCSVVDCISTPRRLFVYPICEVMKWPIIPINQKYGLVSKMQSKRRYLQIEDNDPIHGPIVSYSNSPKDNDALISSIIGRFQYN